MTISAYSTWVFVCEECGAEWHFEHEDRAGEHERKTGHAVYQQRKRRRGHTADSPDRSGRAKMK